MVLTFKNFLKVEVDQVLMANYNCDEPKERGFWYDVKVTRKVRRHIHYSSLSRSFC